MRNGLFICLVGPDGCGKTSAGLSLIDRLPSRLKGSDRLYLHWKARLVNRPSNPTGPACKDPHGKPVRSKTKSILYFLAHVAELVAAHHLKIAPVLRRNGLVLIDRYYYDFFVDSRRYRLQLPERLVWAMYRLVPKPDIVLFFDAPPDVLQGRKKEVSFNECVRQREAYRALAGRLSQARIVDANRPLDDVKDEATRLAMECLEQRKGRR